MPTIIRRTNGTTLTTVSDLVIDTTSTPIALLGRGAVGFSEAMAGNLVRLLENFANTIPPQNPLTGQFWWNSTTKIMNNWDGTKWVPVVGNSPSGNTEGSVGGTGITSIGGNTTSSNRIAIWTGATISYNGLTTNIGVSIAEGKIILVTSAETLPATVLPTTLTIGSNVYALAARFPGGIQAGLTMAFDPASYVLNGMATSSEFADLAERYHASEPLEVGDIVEIGGVNEVQKCHHNFAFGVVSGFPAFLMNSNMGDDANYPAIALVGRVPVKIQGPILKGSRVMSSVAPGIGQAASNGITPQKIIGYALADKSGDEVGLVEVALKI
jgi:hypothetical protein